MALTDLTSAQLKRLVQLIKEKETLQARLEEMNRSLEALEKGDVSGEGKVRLRRRGRRRRGGLKEDILKCLGSAGKAGMTIKELAEKLGAKHSSVAVWFYTAGKKVKGIEKVGTGKYAYVSD
jgi:hypothetical protein